jgi:inosine/xanthosine triphosphatase
MRINIGSRNNVKINAVKEVIRDYDFLSKAKALGVDVNSEVSEQPKSIDETISGAMNRAKNAFQDCNYSFGLEDGLMKISKTKTGYMNVCACAIYDGKNYHIGLAPAFEYPHNTVKLVFTKGLDMNQAFYKVGLTKNPKVGSAEGGVGILTHGRLPRKEYIKQAIIMALIHLENPKLF